MKLDRGSRSAELCSVTGSRGMVTAALPEQEESGLTSQVHGRRGGAAHLGEHKPGLFPDLSKHRATTQTTYMYLNYNMT